MPSSVDRFFAHYYHRYPVNATFTGVHEYDHLLPDWSPSGLEELEHATGAIASEIRQTHSVPASRAVCRDDPEELDAGLACDFLDIQLAECASGHGVRGNPALWTGEAIFSVLSLMIRDFAPVHSRVQAAVARMTIIPAFLDDARRVLGERAWPEAWTARALRDCDGGAVLFSTGIGRWVRSGAVPEALVVKVTSSASRARAALAEFAAWLRARTAAPMTAASCGESLFGLLLERGHQCARSRSELLADARERFVAQRALRNESARVVAGSWDRAQEELAAAHPPGSDYLGAFDRIWSAARDVAVAGDVVTWPDWPIRFAPYPDWTNETAPHVYYLHYRSPAPFDRYGIHDYVVPPLPAGDATEHLRGWNYGVMKLNHVIHHGGIGHHVQNWHAAHQRHSRIGMIAAVDCANRIGMFCGGTMAEGWATYVTGLMDELGFLTPLERVADRHTAVRMLGRAIVDIELHQGTMSLDDAERFYRDEVGMSAAAARGEAVKNSMFPGTGIMYWLGTQTIIDLRRTLAQRRGPDWSLKHFHDELLGFGSVPVPLVAQLLA
jgi:hypothetical protein